MLTRGVDVMKKENGTDEEKKTIEKEIKRHSHLAEKLTETCYQVSVQAKLKLGPREFQPQNNFKIVTPDFLLG